MSIKVIVDFRKHELFHCWLHQWHWAVLLSKELETIGIGEIEKTKAYKWNKRYGTEPLWRVRSFANGTRFLIQNVPTIDKVDFTRYPRIHYGRVYDGNHRIAHYVARGWDCPVRDIDHEMRLSSRS